MQVEILEALGFVDRAAHPRFVLRMPDGATRIEDAPIGTADDLFGPISDTQFTTNTPASWRAIKQSEVSTTIVDRALVFRFTAIDQDATKARDHEGRAG